MIIIIITKGTGVGSGQQRGRLLLGELVGAEAVHELVHAGLQHLSCLLFIVCLACVCLVLLTCCCFVVCLLLIACCLLCVVYCCLLVYCFMFAYVLLCDGIVVVVFYAGLHWYSTSADG